MAVTDDLRQRWPPVEAIDQTATGPARQQDPADPIAPLAGEWRDCPKRGGSDLLYATVGTRHLCDGDTVLADLRGARPMTAPARRAV